MSPKGRLSLLITKLTAVFLIVCQTAMCAAATKKNEAAPAEYLFYVGTYTDKQGKGIYAFRMNAGDGKVTPLGLAAESRNPSFLTADPAGTYLYAVNEIGEFNGQKSGAVSAFRIEKKSGMLKLLNQVPSEGWGPAYAVLDRTERYTLTANYGAGSIAVLPVHPDGTLGGSVCLVQHHGSGPKPNQSMPRPHSIGVSADDRYVVVADLALDELISYPFDRSSGALDAKGMQILKLEPGVGPRHFIFHPTQNFAYVITEMASTVIAMAYDPANGSLKKLQSISTLPKVFAGVNNAAEVQVHPSGKFLYASNRGDDSIAVFAVDDASGMLTLIETVPTVGKEPRHFAMDAKGRYMVVANQNSNQIAIFRIDEKSGRLLPTGQSLAVPSPVVIRFVPVQ